MKILTTFLFLLLTVGYVSLSVTFLGPLIVKIYELSRSLEKKFPEESKFHNFFEYLVTILSIFTAISILVGWALISVYFVTHYYIKQDSLSVQIDEITTSLEQVDDLANQVEVLGNKAIAAEKKAKKAEAFVNLSKEEQKAILYYLDNPVNKVMDWVGSTIVGVLIGFPLTLFLQFLFYKMAPQKYKDITSKFLKKEENGAK